jgi:hypothetical protein
LEGKSLNSGSWETFDNPACVGFLSFFNFFLDDFNDNIIIDIRERGKASGDSLSLRGLVLSFLSE